MQELPGVAGKDATSRDVGPWGYVCRGAASGPDRLTKDQSHLAKTSITTVDSEPKRQTRRKNVEHTMAKNRANEFCCLCGRLSTAGNLITREHVPPKQFYPVKLRRNVNLWVVPSCETCNQGFKSHEEYFLHALYPLVRELNPSVAADVWEDLQRRAKQPQTRRLFRQILSKARRTTLGGIVLPQGAVELSIDLYRIQQVAMKIARCLYFLKYDRFLREENCKDIRICTSEDAVPEMYRISWEFDKVQSSKRSLLMRTRAL